MQLHQYVCFIMWCDVVCYELLVTLFIANPQDIDKFSNLLWKEETYYSCMASNPVLWGEK